MDAMHHPFKDDFSNCLTACSRYFPLRAGLRAAVPVFLFTAISACAQTSAPAQPSSAPPVSAPETAPGAATPAPATPPSASASAQGPAYTASNIALAFTYIDGNKDGKISREEAAGFRGVAKYFDEADVNKDEFLSREEFENAMNRSKPK
jgi:EF hand